MATTQEDIRRWLKRADEDTKYMLVLCDTFDYSDYPVYCKTAKEAIQRKKNCSFSNMTRFMECYDLSMDLESQLNATRVNNMPKGGK